jgi:hypothetical protein
VPSSLPVSRGHDNEQCAFLRIHLGGRIKPEICLTSPATGERLNAGGARVAGVAGDRMALQCCGANVGVRAVQGASPSRTR